MILEVLLRFYKGPELLLLVAGVHPLVAHDTLEGGALRRVQHQKLLQQVLAVRRHVERYSDGIDNYEIK